VGVVLVLWLFLLGRSRRGVTLPEGWWVLALAAIAVRLWWIPALSDHVFDGHEAEYWDLFRGVREPTRGGTVMIPAMQWFWWLAGKLLPAWPQVPVVLMTLLGVASIGAAAGSIGVLCGRRAGWVAALLLSVHPAHAAWSSSAYNVIMPHFFSAMAMLAAALAVKGVGPARLTRWLCATSLVLAISTRMDSGTTGLLVVGWVLFVRPNGESVMDRLRDWVVPGVVTLGLAGLCAWPMLWPGALPGAGERELSLAINMGFIEPYLPSWSVLGLAATVVAALLAVRRRAQVALPLVVLIIVHHLLMASFDDFGERHALVVAPAITGLFGIAGVWGTARGLLVVLVGLCLSVAGLRDQAQRYYGAEDDFATLLSESPWADLPRVDTASARESACGWVAEDARVAAEPVSSHFNILRPEEEASLRGPDGCLQWCLDVQDWRWSSRGVRDRALRLSHLFALTPSHVVTDSATGYACLAMDVGHRAQSNPWSDDGNHSAASSSDHPIP